MHKTIVQWAAYITLGLVSTDTTAVQNPLQPPSPEAVAMAREIVAAMRENPRGPYQRIAWFCNDGSIQPPEAFACRERGGGRQHAVYSTDRQRLAELGWRVGTIFAAQEPGAFRDTASRDARLRELALERYLTDIDDGWVLRRAQNYRGRVQIEDEEAAGRELLLALLQDIDWVATNFLLLRESVRVIPHAGTGDPSRELRRGATVLAEQAPGFEALRTEIHTAPGVTTATRVRAWAARQQDPAVVALAGELAEQLDGLYGPAGRSARLANNRQQLARSDATRALAAKLPDAGQDPGLSRVARLATYLQGARELSTSTLPATVRLRALDTMADVEAELMVSVAEELATAPLTRGELLDLARQLVTAAFGVGLLSAGEDTYLQSLLPNGPGDLSAIDYRRLTQALRRVPAWAAGSVRYTYAEALVSYGALDTRATLFVDDLLRGSVLLPLAEVTRRLALDAELLTGVRRRVLGTPAEGLFALNSGVATGRLRILDDPGELDTANPQRNEIVVLPETAADLPPVAGILTLGEGNPLSHMQLLARNFGIPNVSILPSLLPRLAASDGAQIMLAASSAGDVLVEQVDRLPAAARAMLAQAAPTTARVRVPAPSLDITEPIPLAALGRRLSGRVVGPKAANLGELNRLFPGRVAPALALPFGIFAEHLSSNEPDLRAALVAAYAIEDEAERALALAELRAAIANLSLNAATRRQVTALMAASFGPPDGYGLFVRSDTNVEDLPQFTGAGLNETVPNVVGLDAQLATVPRVWASVLSDRAIAWRATVLENPADVFVSVLLMKSVPATKSGVLVTSNLAEGGPGLTVSTAWGVGGAVAGEAAETLVLLPDGTDLLLAEAKSPWQRGLAASGGIDWRPAPEGPVLAAAERAELRQLAAEVLARYTPALDEAGQPRPWDIEFGFVTGQLTLFQIRPLVEKSSMHADRVIRTLVGTAPAPGPGRVALDELPLVPREMTDIDGTDYDDP